MCLWKYSTTHFPRHHVVVLPCLRENRPGKSSHEASYLSVLIRYTFVKKKTGALKKMRAASPGMPEKIAGNRPSLLTERALLIRRPPLRGKEPHSNTTAAKAPRHLERDWLQFTACPPAFRATCITQLFLFSPQVCTVLIVLHEWRVCQLLIHPSELHPHFWEKSPTIRVDFLFLQR